MTDQAPSLNIQRVIYPTPDIQEDFDRYSSEYSEYKKQLGTGFLFTMPMIIRQMAEARLVGNLTWHKLYKKYPEVGQSNNKNDSDNCWSYFFDINALVMYDTTHVKSGEIPSDSIQSLVEEYIQKNSNKEDMYNPALSNRDVITSLPTDPENLIDVRHITTETIEMFIRASVCSDMIDYAITELNDHKRSVKLKKMHAKYYKKAWDQVYQLYPDMPRSNLDPAWQYKPHLNCLVRAKNASLVDYNDVVRFNFKRSQ